MDSRQFLLFTVLTFLPVTTFSQSNDSLTVIRKPVGWKLAYNSSLIYPGARAGIEIPVKSIRITRENRPGKIPSLTKYRFITANIGWYHHPEFHDNIYPTAGFIMRRTKSSGFITEFSPEIGYSRTYLGATTYRIDNNGRVTIEKHAGYSYMLLSVGEGVGYDFSVTRSKPFIAFLKFNLLMMFPYNSTIYLRPAIDAGLIFTPSDFLRVRFTSKSTTR